MLKIFNTLLAGSLLLLSSCGGQYKENENGLRYRIIRQQSGEKIKVNDIVQVNLTYSTMRDSLLYDSRVIGDSFILRVTPPTFKGGFEEGLILLGEGDSAEFLLPADSVFRNLFQQVRPAYIEEGSTLKFRVGIKNILSKKELDDKIRKDYAMQQQAQVVLIEQYMAANSLHARPSSPGVYFILFKEGTGKIPVNGDSVEVKYTGKTLQGKVFDSNTKGGGNLKFRLGQEKYLKSWEMAIMNMKEGSLARLILSSDNAFKKSTSAPVPPDTPVMFDIELIRIYPKGSL